MGVSAEDINDIAKVAAEKALESLTGCISAGHTLAREHDSFHALYKTPIIYQVNVKGLVTSDDLKIPYSELAIHARAAGKEVLAFFCTPQMAFVAYQDDGCCNYVFGLQDELMSHRLQDKVKEGWGPKPTQNG